MSNFKNAFGNAGWIQSMMDRSRGKTRPGEKRKKAAKHDAARRKKLLEEDPLYQKYTQQTVTVSPSTHVRRPGILSVPRGT